MFKDYDKYLKASLKVYLFLLVVIVILKLIGLDYFGIGTNNACIVKFGEFISSNHWGDIYNFITMYIIIYFFLCLSTNKKKLYIEALITTALLFIFQCVMIAVYKIDGVYQIACLIVFAILPSIILKRPNVKQTIKCIVLLNVYQLISLFIRNVGVSANYNNFLIDSILNIDQLLLLAITYNIHFMKGDEKICGVELVQSSSLQMKKNFSNLLKKLQRNYSNFKELNKQEKATIIIYTILSLIWNIFTLVVVLLIGKLNDTLIECIFIISSFWLSKKVFGKPFHLKSMLQCFVLSNLTYYILIKITTPLGISILVPIMLGVGLSYITSKLVKKSYKPLYKGMSKEDFENTITKVADKGSTKYSICYDYFIEKQSAIYLSYKYKYTEAGIRKITSRINDSIKALNK